MQLKDGQAGATEDERATEQVASKTTTVQTFMRKRPSKKPFPEHLPRERVVIDAPKSCPCCGSGRLSKLGEDITETLEVIPRQWKVIRRSARGSPVANAGGSPSRQRRSTRRLAGSLAQTSWR